ncbi:MAG: hypothetical protein GX188_05265 [Syntrophomonadaceae bacterium]|jgi:hypothetical protein|nr:hypothetical protein [Thermoanaerobacterales bacterium]NLN21392.1 hypothetical protein [Syntrophomonadaceae bacterium]
MDQVRQAIIDSGLNTFNINNVLLAEGSTVSLNIINIKLYSKTLKLGKIQMGMSSHRYNK